jgi:tetratricopeptide (TPR) repeat protein
MAWDSNPKTLERAADAYRRAIAAMPEWTEAHINLGTTLYQLGLLQESCDAFSRAVELDPGNALAHFNFGCVVDRLGDSQTAMEQFRAAIERQPHMADAHLNLALVYEKAGRIPDALAHLSRYLRYDPQGNWAPYARKRLEAGRNAAANAKTGAKITKVTPFRRTER